MIFLFLLSLRKLQRQPSHLPLGESGKNSYKTVQGAIQTSSSIRNCRKIKDSLYYESRAGLPLESDAVKVADLDGEGCGGGAVRA